LRLLGNAAETQLRPHTSVKLGGETTLICQMSVLYQGAVEVLPMARPYIENVIAPTRKALPPHKKLENPVSDRLQPLVARVPE